MRKVALVSVLVLLALLALGSLYLLFWPVPIKPVAWEAPPIPAYTGPYASNHRLAAFERVPIGEFHGPEAMAVDREGRLYAATEEGWIVRLDPDGTNPTPWVDTGGRPLGMAFDSGGTMYVADAVRGLVTVSPGGEVRVVASEADGVPIRIADDLDLADDGRVYLSDASTRFFPPRWDIFTASHLEIMEHEGTGRLLEYDPASGRITTLARGLVFANGVAMSHDQRSVLVNETGSYRVLRVWRDGPRRGEVETLIDALPGFPDNITRGSDGRYWVALFGPRIALLDQLSGRPFVRKVIQRLPEAMSPKPIHYGHVIAVDDSGRVVADLQDPAGGFTGLTSVLEVPGWLYLGSVLEPTAARVSWDPEAVPGGL